MNLPYGKSNFAEIRRGGYYYADKTRFLPALEDARRGRHYLTFLRPRRFGKSTLLSMLEHYYDVLQAPHFDELFGGLAIAAAPTPERSRYAVLRVDFSGISADGGIDQLRADFFGRVQDAIEIFLEHYRASMPRQAAAFEARGATDSPASLMNRFLSSMHGGPFQIYVLIDEYDSFVTGIIGRGDDEVYADAILAGGFVRAFYQTLKEGTAIGVIGRLFMTGVTPIALNDLSSAFNIASHISRALDLHELCGLSADEVGDLLDQILGEGGFSLARDEVMADLTRYYNGYLFHEEATSRLYNPDMVLHFFKELSPPAAYPAELLDPNIRVDVRRLDSLLFAADRTPRRHPIELVRSLLAEGHVEADLHDMFPLEWAHDEEFFASYLYYMGFLSIERRERMWLRMVIPNHVIQGFYGDTFRYILEQSSGTKIEPDPVKGALMSMAWQGDIEPFLRLLQTEVLSLLSNRDLIRLDEKGIKLAMLAMLSFGKIFLVWSELELGQGYGDLILTLNKGYPDARYSYLIELKYLKAGAQEKAAPPASRAGKGRSRASVAKPMPGRVEASMRDGEEQLTRYLADPRLTGMAGPGGWKTVTVVFAGTKAIYLREPGQKTRALAGRGKA